MVDMRIIWKAQIELCKKIAEDIVKHKANPGIIKHAKGFAHLENEYGEFWRVNFGEAYAYVDVDKKGKPNGNIWWNNDEMGIIDSNSYESSIKALKYMTLEEAYNNCSCTDCYDCEEGNETQEYTYKEYKERCA